jgi:hypothetical protein
MRARHASFRRVRGRSQRRRASIPTRARIAYAVATFGIQRSVSNPAMAAESAAPKMMNPAIDTPSPKCGVTSAMR